MLLDPRQNWAAWVSDTTPHSGLDFGTIVWCARKLALTARHVLSLEMLEAVHVSPSREEGERSDVAQIWCSDEPSRAPLH